MSARYSRDAILSMVQEDRVHRDLYISQELFELEQRHFFANTWNYAGHASQIPLPGDFFTVEIAGQPLIAIRQADAQIRVLFNRCPHKGMPLATDACGNAGRALRCPYHSWTFKLDGSALGTPLRAGYENTRLKDSENGQGMQPVRHVQVYRDFIFVKINDAGLDFHEYFGPVLQAIDNLVDRSPVGRLHVEGGCIRNIVHANWKMYFENINDPVHPLTAHESATAAAAGLWKDQPADAPKPMAMEQILPFGSGYDFFDGMGGRAYANGHTMLGTRFSIHSNYAQVPEYEAALVAAHGQERTREILERSPQNSVCFPSLSVKSSPQAIRVIRPLGVDRTLIEAWSFRPEGAPEVMLERAMMYNRLVFSPMSVVAHDDVHLFESMQRGLRAGSNPWVSLHRDFSPGELDAQGPQEVNGTSELLMRVQFRAWARFMTADMA